jgi:hypothetical protein
MIAKAVRNATAVFLSILSSVTVCAAQGEEVIAVITELKLNKGDIQITHPGRSTAERPAILQSLYHGSRLHVSKNAVATILFTDGMRTVTVDENNSPFEIKSAAKSAHGHGRFKDVANTLLGKKSPPDLVPLTVRGKSRGPTLLTPRETKLLTPTPRFQWVDMEEQPRTIKVFGPSAMLWSLENVAATQLDYPSSAPALRPGDQYSWSVEERGGPAEWATFTLLSPEESQAIQDQLAEIGSSDTVSETTVAVVKGSFLISRELYYDAREILLEAAIADPEEPTLHFLLGEVYENTGIKHLAQEEYSQAQLLGTKEP